MKRVLRTATYRDDLEKTEARIAEDNPKAGLDMWFHIDDQVRGHFRKRITAYVKQAALAVAA